MTQHSLSARERLAFALDVPNAESAETWLDTLAPSVGLFKVGLELFTACGPDVVRLVTARAACFLDLKLHDIPATMAGAARSAARLGVRYLTVHASAGPAALEATLEALEGSSTQLLAVTVLTSMDSQELNACGVEGEPEDQVLRLASMATQAGVSGFVSSPGEAATLRTHFPKSVLVTPGIRPEGSERGDQRRAATPSAAIRAGADVLVVGRPIRLAENPVAAAASILATIEAER
ncbi:MAG: orotidine-5'-phosphate decarboxylase [Polyangiales bacterium]